MSATFFPNKILNNLRKGNPLGKFEYRSCTDKELCFVACLKEYIKWRDKSEGLNTTGLIFTLKNLKNWCLLILGRDGLKKSFLKPIL